MSTLDAQKIELDCPHCSHKVRETLGRLRKSPTLVCPKCRGSITVDGADLDKQLRGVDKQLGNFSRRISKTFK